MQMISYCKGRYYYRHRSVNNFLMNLIAALGAYCFFDNKPEVGIVLRTPINSLCSNLIPNWRNNYKKSLSGTCSGLCPRCCSLDKVNTATARAEYHHLFCIMRCKDNYKLRDSKENSRKVLKNRNIYRFSFEIQNNYVILQRI